MLDSTPSRELKQNRRYAVRRTVRFGWCAEVFLLGLLGSAYLSAQTADETRKRAERLAEQGDWYNAGTLYAEAEVAYRKAGDVRNELYAKFGRLRREVEAGSYAAVRAEVVQDLARPIVANDAQLKIRGLALLGSIDLNLNSSAARDDWNQVLEVATASGDAKWQNRARGELGLLAGVNGDISAAGLALFQAIETADKLGDVAGHLQFSIWLAHGMAVNGMPDRALSLIDRATESARRNGYTETPLTLHSARIRALMLLPEPRRSKAFSDAKKTLASAIAEAQKNKVVGAQTELLRASGELASEAGDIAGAESSFRQAVEIARRASLPREEAAALLHLSEFYRARKEPTKAYPTIRAGISALQRVEEGYDLPRFVAEQAHVEDDLGKIAEADASYERATDLIEGLLVNAPSSQVKSSMIGALSDIYVAHFRLAWIRLHDGPKAFRIIENARGRALFDSIRYARQEGRAIRPTADELEIAKLQRLLLHQDLTIAQTRRILVRLDEAYDRLTPVEYRRARNEMAILRRAPVTVDALRRILGPKESLVDYVLDKQGSYALQITQAGLKIHSLPGRVEIGKNARAFVTAIRNKSEAKASALALYQQVIKPLFAERSTSLIVIPDGPLHLIPFGALIDEQGAYLNTRLTISAAPSATIYATLRASARRSSAFRPFLGVAYSEPGGLQAASTKRGFSELRAANLKPLQFGREEIGEAAQAMGAGSVTLAGSAASEAALKAQPLGDFKVIHLAAHGVSNESEPDRAALVFEPGNQVEDGLWQAREIRRTRLNADVVVLSACETGSGLLQGQEGVMNLARAFLTAGAKSVVASLWSVDDRSTATLMEYFYSHVAEGSPVKDALRLAQLDFAKDFGEKAKPYLWAGFEVIGDGTRQLKFETNPPELRGARADLR
jgi:CHAT domain-containing protein